MAEQDVIAVVDAWTRQRISEVGGELLHVLGGYGDARYVEVLRSCNELRDDCGLPILRYGSEINDRASE